MLWSLCEIKMLETCEEEILRSVSNYYLLGKSIFFGTNDQGSQLGGTTLKST